MDIIFHHKGRLREGAKLAQIPVSDPYDREVLIDSDTNEIFLVSSNSIGTLSVRTLTLDEWSTLRSKHGLTAPRLPNCTTKIGVVPRPAQEPMSKLMAKSHS